MGLVGFLLAPLAAQMSIDYLPPRDFARRPLQWLDLISRTAATHLLQPELRLRTAARRGAAQVPARSRPLRVARCRHRRRHGPHRRAGAIRRDVRAGSGFNRTAFVPSYGMAEVGLAITFAPHRHARRHGRPIALVEAQRAEPAAIPSDGDAPARFVGLRQGAARPRARGARRGRRRAARARRGPDLRRAAPA